MPWRSAPRAARGPPPVHPRRATPERSRGGCRRAVEHGDAHVTSASRGARLWIAGVGVAPHAARRVIGEPQLAASRGELAAVGAYLGSGVNRQPHADTTTVVDCDPRRAA